MWYIYVKKAFCLQGFYWIRGCIVTVKRVAGASHTYKRIALLQGQVVAINKFTYPNTGNQSTVAQSHEILK